MLQSKSICCVKGVSGSGKSTRVFLLIQFLEKVCRLPIEDFSFVNKEGKRKNIGILFPDLDLVFIGKKYVTGNFERFQGYDVMTGSFGKSSDFSDFLREYHTKYNFVVEGAGVTATNRLRPLFLHEFCGFNDILIQYYNYGMDQKDKYLERILYRSGKVPDKATMWEKCSGFISDHQHSLDEIEQIKSKNVIAITCYNTYDTHNYDFGVKLLTFLYINDFIPYFIDFCKSSNYIELNSFNNFGDGK